MATRVVEGKKPYTGGKAISIDENKVISLNLRDENNLIIYDEGDDEIYVDLQLDDEITPTSAFPIGVNVGRVIVDNGWDLAGTIISAETTSGDNIKIFYADEGTLWIDNGTGTFKQIYFKADVDALLLALRNYIDGELAKKQNGVSSDTAPSNPSEGDLWYDTTNSAMKVWDGTAWQSVGTGGGGSDIEYVTQAEYNALLPGALTDNKHYFIYTPSVVPPTPSGRPTITGFTYEDLYSGYTTSINGITFKPDGTKVYFIGESDNTIKQYSLGTAWDITTAVSDNISKSVSSQTSISSSVIFSDDGLTMWVVGSTGWNPSGGYIFQYTLSTARDVSTASYDNIRANIGGYITSGKIYNNGQYLYVISREGNYLRRYTMATPYDISTLSNTYQEITLSYSNHDIVINPDGNQMFILSRWNIGSLGKVYILSLSTAWDITTSSETSSYTIPTPSSDNITAMTIDNDGNSMYLGGVNIGGVYQYSTTTS